MSGDDRAGVGLAKLLCDRRFAPHFVTQFLGAFNDNVFKQALIIFITFQAVTGASTESAQWVTIAGGIFILPFLVASPLAGQLADKYPKTLLIQRIKLAELFIMCAGALAFWLQSLPFLLAVLFVMGLQSSMFGPLKYGIVPQLIEKVELPAGNGLLQASTYLAILLGTSFGGLLMAEEALGWGAVSVAVLLLAAAGFAASNFIAAVPAAAPAISIDWNLWRQALVALRFARSTPSVLAAIVGISWFWFLGATNLQLLPTFGRDLLGGDAQVVTLLLVMFSVGIGLGALSSAVLMRTQPFLGIVCAGAIGIALFGVVPWGMHDSLAGAAHEPGARDVAQVLSDASAWPVLLSFLGLALCGGLFVVPLFVVMQTQSRLRERARVIAANNIMNALFMVSSAVGTVVLLGLSWAISTILGATALLSVPLYFYISRDLRSTNDQ